MSLVRIGIQVTGVVQGVGFRPFAWQLANHLACTGWVRNSASGVEIELQGPAPAIELFLDRLRQRPPPLAQVSSVVRQNLPLLETERDFKIVSSDQHGQPLAWVSADIAVCRDCLSELRDCTDRRYRYPFINCTHCGPRFTIQRAVPYDRPQTTMQPFVMCASCHHEYQSPDNRRFHAQPNACPACGPAIAYFCPASDDARKVSKEIRPQSKEWTDVNCSSDAVIERVRSDIKAGLIVAIKGIGGFHLACDATQASAIRRLRRLKNRPFKPLAVMVGDIETAAQLVRITPLERELLLSQQRPIVLLPKRSDHCLADEIAPGNPLIGVVLPYAPLHYLLLDQKDIWVMTSGNLAEEPIAYEDRDAIDRLSHIADSFLLHNRPIHTACDDSVMRTSELGLLPIRRSRGYAPLPIQLGQSGPTILAIGGELKATICLATGDLAIMGQHLGDMVNRETVEALEHCSQHLQSLYRTAPIAYVCDQHPGYHSSSWAKKKAQMDNVPLLQVQHHHAHAASLMAEHQLCGDQAIIACVLDGAGYGDDGCIWGGEILIANARSYRRAAHLQYAPLPGGDKCILHPSRTALGFLYGAGLTWHDELPSRRFFSESDLRRLHQQLLRQINVVQTSSVGRLFDAVASLIGLCHSIDYEGQAAIELEALAESAVQGGSYESQPAYDFRWSPSKLSQLHYGPMLAAICQEMTARVDPALIALKFHRTVARAFSEQCARIRADESLIGAEVQVKSSNLKSSNLKAGELKAGELNCVGLTGGVFQNALLLRLMHDQLVSLGFHVLIHSVVPANDGGLALGQAFIGRQWMSITADCQGQPG